MVGGVQDHDAGNRLDVRESGTDPGGVRPWLQVYFSCTGQYVRVYRRADGSGYTARCPTCMKAIKFQVGEGGTSQRFFTVSCR
jgi:hypothetical protein